MPKVITERSSITPYDIGTKVLIHPTYKVKKYHGKSGVIRAVHLAQKGIDLPHEYTVDFEDPYQHNLNPIKIAHDHLRLSNA